MDLPYVLMDEPVRTCPEVDMPRLLQRIESSHTNIKNLGASKGKTLADLGHTSLAMLHNIPSAARLRAALMSDDGKFALKRSSVGAETIMAHHRRIYPHLMRMMFDLMAEKKQPAAADLAGRFATAVAELGFANYPNQPIKPRLLSLLGNVDEGIYIRVVQDSAWEYATRRMADILRGRSGAQDLTAQFEMARDSAAFTNWLLTPERVSPIYAQEILNAVELAGYEVDALDIQHAVIERAKITECDLQFD